MGAREIESEGERGGARKGASEWAWGEGLRGRGREERMEQMCERLSQLARARERASVRTCERSRGAGEGARKDVSERVGESEG
jgi:hypothetical protein